MKKATKGLIKLLGFIIFFVYFMFVSYILLNMAQALPGFRAVNNKKLKEIAKHVHALKTANGSRYCSSSAVQYKGEVYTLTNVHCCEAIDEFGKDSVRVGNTIERILYTSVIADVCVLTSSDKTSTLKLANKEPEILDPVMLLGFPRGEDMTPRFGHIIVKNRWTSVDYGEYILTRPSDYITTLTFPGNSGSAIFNKNGEIVGLLYAGPHPLFQYGIAVPLRFITHAIRQASRVK